MRRIMSVFSAAALTLTLLIVIALAGVTEKKLRVNGMTCGGCSASVERALKKVNGVMEAKANHGSEGKVWVKYDDEKVELSKIKQVIADVGFKVVDR